MDGDPGLSRPLFTSVELLVPFVLGTIESLVFPVAIGVKGLVMAGSPRLFDVGRNSDVINGTSTSDGTMLSGNMAPSFDLMTTGTLFGILSGW